MDLYNHLSNLFHIRNWIEKSWMISISMKRNNPYNSTIERKIATDVCIEPRPSLRLKIVITLLGALVSLVEVRSASRAWYTSRGYTSHHTHCHLTSRIGTFCIHNRIIIQRWRLSPCFSLFGTSIFILGLSCQRFSSSQRKRGHLCVTFSVFLNIIEIHLVTSINGK